MSVPHSVQPCPAHCSGGQPGHDSYSRVSKSLAFRHADKTQRLNLGWISAQFKRKHYHTYINTCYKQLMSSRNHLLALRSGIERCNCCVWDHKLPARKSAAATSGSIARQTPRPVFLLDCSQGSHAVSDVDIGYSTDTKMIKVKSSSELDSPETRKAVIQLAREYHRAGASVLLWFHHGIRGYQQG